MKIIIIYWLFQNINNVINISNLLINIYIYMTFFLKTFMIIIIIWFLYQHMLILVYHIK